MGWLLGGPRACRLVSARPGWVPSAVGGGGFARAVAGELLCLSLEPYGLALDEAIVLRGWVPLIYRRVERSSVVGFPGWVLGRRLVSAIKRSASRTIFELRVPVVAVLGRVGAALNGYGRVAYKVPQHVKRKSGT